VASVPGVGRFSPPPVATAAARVARATRTSGLARLLAAFLFLLPMAALPPFNFVRFALLGTPVRPPSDTARDFSIGILLQPDFIAALLLLFLAVTQARGALPARSRRMSALLIAIALMTVLGGGLATIVSAWPGVSLFGLLMRLGAIALALAVLRLRPDEATLRLWCQALLAGVTLMGLNAIRVYYEIFGASTLAGLPTRRSDPRFDTYELALFGTAGENTAVLLALVPIALVLLFRSHARSERIVGGLALAVMLTNLLLNFSRWGWIVLVLGVLAMLWYWRGRRRGMLLMVGLAAVSLRFGEAIIRDLGGYFLDALNPETGSNVTDRRELAERGLALLWDNPAGYGFGSVNAVAYSSSSHNQLLDIAIEGGVIVFISAAIWIAYVGWTFLRVTLTARGEHDLTFALLLGLAMFLVKGMSSATSLVGHGMWIWIALWFLLPAMGIAALDSAEAARLRARPAVPPQEPKVRLHRL
jgi:hypothetical protein